jgi:hypothetical protein
MSAATAISAKEERGEESERDRRGDKPLPATKY